MGFDIGYHTIKKEYFFNDLIPYCLGEKENLDDLISDIARVRRNRFIANHFGEIVIQKSRAEPTGFFKKCISKITSPKQKTFNPDLYAWGRPFLVLEDTSSKVTEVIKKYCSATKDQDVLSIVESQLKLIAPDFYELNLTAGMTYSDSASKEKELTESLKNHASEFKKIVQMSLNGEKDYIDLNNQRHNMKNALASIPFQFVELLSGGCPAWMDRGLINPTSLVSDLGLQTPNYIKPASTLLGDLKKKLHLHNSARSISENYSLGAVVLPENIKEFVEFFNAHYAQFKYFLIKEHSYKREDADLVLQKINETLAYFLHMNMMFIESTDIFSPFEGQIA